MSKEVRVMSLPRGTPNSPDLKLDLSLLDLAESRLYEVRLNNPAMAKELEGLFNEAANLAAKYLAWIEFELLQARKNLDLERATVLIDVIPLKALELKETGMKMNEDLREAIIMREPAYIKALDTYNSLLAAQSLIKANMDTFVRAHYSARNKDKERSFAPTPQFNGNWNNNE